MTDTRYRDGATVRRTRLLDIIEYVEKYQGTSQSPRLEGIQSWMTLKHGMRRGTTEGYVRELRECGVLKEDKFGQLWTRMSIAQLMGIISPNSTGILVDVKDSE